MDGRTANQCRHGEQADYDQDGISFHNRLLRMEIANEFSSMEIYDAISQEQANTLRQRLCSCVINRCDWDPKVGI